MKQRGNTVLVEHGIQTEEADYRAHVCPLVKRIYVFPVGPASEVIMSGRYPTKSAYIGGIETARGAAVPVEDIPHIQEVEMPEAGWDVLEFSEDDPPDDKGRKATLAVSWMLRRGMISLPWSVQRASVAADIVGADLIATGSHRIQVKCDFRGGHRGLGGTGNLYLQTMECNPLGLH